MTLKTLKNHPKKLHTYGSSWEFFFSAAPTAQNSPELHFRFINSFIQLSRVGSLVLNNQKCCSHCIRFYLWIDPCCKPIKTKHIFTRKFWFSIQNFLKKVKNYGQYFQKLLNCLNFLLFQFLPNYVLDISKLIINKLH